MTPGNCRTWENCDNGRVELLFDDIEQRTLPADERHSLRVESLHGAGISPTPAGLRVAMGRMRYGLDKRRVRAPVNASRSPSRFCPTGLAAAPRGPGVDRILRDAEWTSSAKESLPTATNCPRLSPRGRRGFCDSGSRCYTRSAELRNGIAPPGRTIP